MASDWGGERARVFVSCGQNYDEERNIALRVRDSLRELGFGPYVAVEEQSLRGLKENLFEQLRRSEYFVFVDFKREQLPDKGDGAVLPPGVGLGFVP